MQQGGAGHRSGFPPAWRGERLYPKLRPTTFAYAQKEQDNPSHAMDFTVPCCVSKEVNELVTSTGETCKKASIKTSLFLLLTAHIPPAAKGRGTTGLSKYENKGTLTRPPPCPLLPFLPLFLHSLSFFLCRSKS